MIKKIKVDQVKPGIFIHDFNCGWLQHPFLRNRVKINSEQQVEKILSHGIREVYIDTEKGLDVDDAPTRHEVDRAIHSELEVLLPAKGHARPSPPLAQKIVGAQALISDAKPATKRLMEDVRLGKPIDMGQVETLVEKITESVLEDGDALVSLLRIKTKGEYTYLHSLAVSALCMSFGHSMGFDAEKIRAIGIGGLLHDIGKVKIPNEILNKPGPLTEAEFEIMKQHVDYGCALLEQRTDLDENSVCVAAQHHERMDGTGYPQGLRGDQISLFGQVSAIVDIYDALTSERCYGAPVAPTEALRKIFEWSESYLNRPLVEQFVAHIGIYPIGSVVRLRSGAVGLVIRHGEKDLLHPVVRIVFDRRQRRLNRAPDIDLAESASGSDGDQILACDSAERLLINPVQYLLRT